MKLLFEPTRHKVLFAVLFLLFAFTNAMDYKDPVKSEDFTNMFGDDGCIEGTLSMLDLGMNVVEPVTVIESLTNERNKTDNFGGKTPMSLLHELATYNNIEYQYELTDEVGPAHSRKFVIDLKLGEENYIAEGKSIKKAQHEAARLALNSTLYKHPPVKTNDYTKPTKIHETPVEKLNKWAKKHGNAFIKYSFNDQTKKHKDYNHYHKDMYSKAQNVHRVSVNVLSREFTGEGISSEAAKQSAADNALKTLQESEAFCMFDDGIKNLFNRIFTDSTDSPVSLVYQFGSKAKMETTFDLVSEEGPAHIKKFVYKCKIGDRFESFGEGSSKKEAKRDAAESIIKQLKSSIPYDNQCINVEKKKSKRKGKNLVKSVVRTYKDDDESIPEDSKFSFIKEEMNPISKLYQLQQIKHGAEPTFQLVEEKGYPNKEFFMEVRVGDVTFIGSGPSKKEAKKAAANGILTKLGYSSSSSSNRKTNSNRKKNEFQVNKRHLGKKKLLPGINLNSNKFTKLEEESGSAPVESAKPYSYDDTGVKETPRHDNSKLSESKKFEPVEKDSRAKKSGTSPKGELKRMADELGIRFQFSDFPKVGNKGFISLVSLTTVPPKVCYGEGVNMDQSQDKAALTALSSLYKSQLTTISKMLSDDGQYSSKISSEEEFNNINNKETVIDSVIPLETE